LHFSLIFRLNFHFFIAAIRCKLHGNNIFIYFSHLNCKFLSCCFVVGVCHLPCSSPTIKNYFLFVWYLNDTWKHNSTTIMRQQLDDMIAVIAMIYTFRKVIYHHYKTTNWPCVRVNECVWAIKKQINTKNDLKLCQNKRRKVQTMSRNLNMCARSNDTIKQKFHKKKAFHHRIYHWIN
jgi:hypothetical protein